jgi:hypothetical protein
MAVRGASERASVIGNLLLVQREAQAMVFTNTRVRAAQLAEALSDRGVPAVPMHSDLSQSLREMYLDRFRAGAYRSGGWGLRLRMCVLKVYGGWARQSACGGRDRRGGTRA